MDKISVIMPLYNSEKFLKNAVDSVRGQSYPNWELIIVDDASTDRSLSLAQNFAREDMRIKVFKMPKNKGVAAARNLAITYAIGRYIAFLDSDDVWGKNKLKVQLMFMKKHKVPLSHTAYAYMNEQGQIRPIGRGNVDSVVDLPRYMKTTQINISTVMIDRKQVPHFAFPEDRQLCEDARLWMQLMHQGHQFYGLNKLLTLYRVRENQMSQNKFKMAQNTLKRYWNEKSFSPPQRLFYFLNYAYHGFEKRLRPTRLNVGFVNDRFNYKART